METRSTCDSVVKFCQDRKLVWIEYPGIVKNVDKMLRTLGGINNIQETYKTPNKRIDLRYRPDDPCCHPVCGDRIRCIGLLLRVRKYRKKKKACDAAKPNEFRYIPEIAGVIETAYKFNVLCDYQYLPLHNDTKSTKLVNMTPYLQIKDLSESIYTKDVPLFLPPPTFSRFDQQQDVLFRTYCKYRERGPYQHDRISIARPKRTHYAQYLKFEENWTPREPLPAAREMLEKASSQESLLSGLKKLFEERPIWSKNAIVCLLKTTPERLKNLLPAVAYYFITGPWRSLWVKFGYNPRNHPEAARYQLLNFRVRKFLRDPEIPIKTKRSTLSYRLPNLLPRSRASNNVVSSLNNAASSRTTNILHDESVYMYKPGCLPVYRQMFYQICDIQHPGVAEIVKTHFDSPSSSTCDIKSGWLPEEASAKIRDLLTNDIYETISLEENADIARVQRERNKANKRRPRIHLRDVDRENAPQSELVDSFHSWGLVAGSSSDDGDDFDSDGEIIDENDSFVTLEEANDDEEASSSSNIITDAVENFGGATLDVFDEEQGEANEMDEFLEDFDAFSQDLDDADENEDENVEDDNS